MSTNTGQSIYGADTDFSGEELRNMLQDSTRRDQYDAIEIELDNRHRKSLGLEPL